MAPPLQEIIHKYEVGAGVRILKVTLAFIAFLMLAVWYDVAVFRQLTAEGMDAAQLARNVSRGRGFTTDFVRPFSVHLLRQSAARSSSAAAGAPTTVSTNPPPTAAEAATARLDPHPDLVHPPLYPLLLAGALLAMPFDYPNLLDPKARAGFGPDLWITAFNQLLFLLAGCLLFRLTKRLFDELVAWVSTAVFVGAELMWRFSASGLSTMLLMVLVLALVEVLVRLHPSEGPESPETQSPRRWLLLASAAGGLAGLAGLTRYACVWVMVPVVVWLLGLAHPKRASLIALALGVFALVMAPWVVRNVVWSGSPLGVTGFAPCQGTLPFPGNELERSLQPDFSQMVGGEYWRKFVANARELVTSELPRFGGSWVSAFFLAGLLVPFRNPVLGRLRLFVVLTLAVWGGAQCFAKTGLAADTPEVNSDNLLPVLAPLVFMFGTGFFFILLERITVVPMRYLVTGVFLLVSGSPLLFGLFSQRALPDVYPPWVQEKARRVGEQETIMTDIPWAVAWYGNRQAVWLSLKHKAGPEEKFRNDFYSLWEQFKPVSALYLASKSLQSLDMREVVKWTEGQAKDEDWKRFEGLATSLAKRMEEAAAGKESEDLEQFRELARLAYKHWIRGGEEDWASFLLGVFIKREVPTGFPLRRAPLGLVPEIFLTDSERNAAKSIQSTN
jgi:hypothetical protein